MFHQKFSHLADICYPVSLFEKTAPSQTHSDILFPSLSLLPAKIFLSLRVPLLLLCLFLHIAKSLLVSIRQLNKDNYYPKELSDRSPEMMPKKWPTCITCVSCLYHHVSLPKHGFLLFSFKNIQEG